MISLVILAFSQFQKFFLKVTFKNSPKFKFQIPKNLTDFQSEKFPIKFANSKKYANGSMEVVQSLLFFAINL
jgi:hypothetical protein